MQKHKDCAAHHQSDLLAAKHQLLTIQFGQAQMRLANGIIQIRYVATLDSHPPCSD